MDYSKNSPSYMAKQKLRDFLHRYGDINDKMLTYFETVTNMSAGEILNQLQLTFRQLSNPAEFLDKYGNHCKKEDAYYIWVTTGLDVPTPVGKNEALFIGFVKSTYEDKPGYFCYYIAPRFMLEKTELYNMLLIKSDWAALPDYRVLKELLRLNEAKIENEFRKTASHYRTQAGALPGRNPEHAGRRTF